MIWVGFGPIGNTEKKKFGPIVSVFFEQLRYIFILLESSALHNNFFVKVRRSQEDHKSFQKSSNFF